MNPESAAIMFAAAYWRGYLTKCREIATYNEQAPVSEEQVANLAERDKEIWLPAARMALSFCGCNQETSENE